MYDIEDKTVSREFPLKNDSNILGRGPELCIMEKACSRNQVDINVDSKKERVVAKILGKNACAKKKWKWRMGFASTRNGS